MRPIYTLVIVRQTRSEYEWHCRRAQVIHDHMNINVYKTTPGSIRLGKATHGSLDYERDGVNYRLLRPPLG